MSLQLTKRSKRVVAHNFQIKCLAVWQAISVCVSWKTIASDDSINLSLRLLLLGAMPSYTEEEAFDPSYGLNNVSRETPT